MTESIRDATEEDLQWLRNGFDPEHMAEQVRQEIEEAKTATPMPRHWRPVEVDEALMR
jgi:hypothetical protein